MIFHRWTEIRCGPSSAGAFAGNDFAGHHAALVETLVEARVLLTAPMCHFKYTGGPGEWTAFLRISGGLDSCDAIVNRLNTLAPQRGLGTFVPREWDPVAGMLRSHMGLSLGEMSALLVLWHDWCDVLLNLFASDFTARLAQAAPAARAWFDTQDSSALRSCLETHQAVSMAPAEGNFEAKLGIPALQAGLFIKDSASRSTGPHLLMNSLNQPYP